LADYIEETPEVKLWGKTPAALEAELERYRQKSYWTRQFLSLVTPIRKKEKLLLYYKQRQQFQQYSQTLAPGEQLALHNLSNGHKRMDRNNTNTSSSSSSWFSALSNLFKFKISADKLVSLQPLDELLSLEQCSKAEEDLTSQYQQSYAKFQQECQDKHQSHYSPEQLNQFKQTAQLEFENGQKTIKNHLMKIAFDPTHKRFLSALKEEESASQWQQPFSLIIRKTARIHPGPMANCGTFKPDKNLFDTQLQAIADKLQQQLSEHEIIKSLNAYYQLIETYLQQLSQHGQQLIMQAKARQLSNENEFIKESFTAIAKEIEQTYRQMALQLHPDKTNKYPPAAQTAAAQLFKNLTNLKQKELETLAEISVNPADALAHLKEILTDIERLEKENAELRVSTQQMHEKLEVAEEKIEQLNQQIQAAAHVIIAANDKTKITEQERENLNEVAGALNNQIEQMKKLVDALAISQPEHSQQQQTAKMKFF